MAILLGASLLSLIVSHMSYLRATEQMAMASNLFPSELVLIVTAAVLFYAAYSDLRHYKIRNELILALAVLFFIHAVVSGRWVSAHWNVAFAFLMLVAMLVFYSRHLMGGGDVKLLSIAFLWVGIGCALPFAILLLLCAGIHTAAAKLGWAQIQRVNDGEPKRIPFAPSIAAALIGVFILGCLAPLP
jgi:prepilin peptidase CpaA